ncbi:AAA family ATPase [Candidatus Acidianus copahuensis]|uniref:AAA family ATPase n=1 Tax=Candidatus Acidianus copahuensis TaxID=1160895 RepID=UPI00064F9E02|nr:MoxR family ATPase [Candidatus Acidianus copahuensis]
MDVEWLIKRFKEEGYVLDSKSALAVFLSLIMEKPLLIEGPPGCGKTELAKITAKVLNTELIRLQCYEGLDSSQALYEWDYPRQLLELKMLQAEELSKDEIRKEIYSERFLLERPLLKALRANKRVVLLIDEIDRADPEFEGFLLEFLGEFQITIPEMGTILAKHKPYVFITSNKTRDLSDAIKRRCLYLYIDYPPPEKELEIIKTKLGNVREDLAKDAINLVNKIRNNNKILHKPGIAETLDFINALNSLKVNSIDENVIRNLIGTLLKDEEDIVYFLGD